MTTTSPVEKAGGATATYVDERIGSNKFLSRNLGKVFPDHWSFMLGEIALYSFIVLLLTGVFLTLFFKPSMIEVIYDGSYVPLNGIKMSEAYASTLDISFDVRGGLLMRQIHHWAALIFVAAMAVHMFRVFFTGAFRKPREFNWVIGVALMTLALLAGFSGYSLPDDLLSGTGLRIARGIMQAIPVVGTWTAFLLFGGEFPGTDFIPRLYTVHILLIPGLILGLVTAHLMLVWTQKHTQFPGPGRTNDNVVGYPLLPVYMAKAGGFFFIVFGVIALIGGLVTINPIWVFGPYMPDQVSAGSQPDWYIGFLDGALRIMPNWETVGLRVHDLVEHPDPGADPAGHPVHRPGPLPVHRGLGHRRQARAPPARPPAQRPDPHGARADGDHVLRAAVGRRRQRHHRRRVRPVDQLDHLVPAGGALRRARRSSSSSPGGSASACSAATARSCCTAARPAASCGCRTASSSRSTSRSPSRTWPSSPPRPTTCRSPLRRGPTPTACATSTTAGSRCATSSALLLRGQRRQAVHGGDRGGPAPRRHDAELEAPLHEYEDADEIRNAHGGVLHHPGMAETNAEQLEQERSQH